MFLTFLEFTRRWKALLLAAAIVSVFAAGWKVGDWRNSAALLKAAEKHQAQMANLRQKLLEEHKKRASNDQKERNRLARAVTQLREREHELNLQIDTLTVPDCGTNPISPDFIELWNSELE